MKWIMTIRGYSGADKGELQIESEKIEFDWSDENKREMFMGFEDLVGDLAIADGGVRVTTEYAFSKPDVIK